MTEFKEVGGARIGIWNVSWPLASLTVRKDSIQLYVVLFGSMTLKQGDVISIQTCSGFLNSGIRINHRVSGHNKNIIFWCFGNPHTLIKRIEDTGFFENNTAASENH